MAKSEYKRDPNPFLRYKKEEKFSDMIQKIFQKMGYVIKSVSIGPSKPKGPDIILEDNNKSLIPLELKAYQRFGKIGQSKDSLYIRDEIKQLLNYIKRIGSPYGYLVTSTDRRTFKKSPRKTRIIFGKEVRKLLIEFGMTKEIRDLEWIRNSSISSDKEETYKKIRKRILIYVKRRIKKEQYTSRREILRKFRVNPDSYFAGGTTEIYKTLKINPIYCSHYRMSRNFNKEEIREQIILFIGKEYGNGHLPTYKEIQKRFNCFPKLYFPGGIREMVNSAGIKYERKFANKTLEEKELIKRKIIEYAKEKNKSGIGVKYRDIRRDLLVGPRNYFRSIKEIREKAKLI